MSVNLKQNKNVLQNIFKSKIFLVWRIIFWGPWYYKKSIIMIIHLLMAFIFPRTISFHLEPPIHLILQFSVIFLQEKSVILHFLVILQFLVISWTVQVTNISLILCVCFLFSTKYVCESQSINKAKISCCWFDSNPSTGQVWVTHSWAYSPSLIKVSSYKITQRQHKAWHSLARGGGQKWPWPLTLWPKIKRVPPLIMNSLCEVWKWSGKNCSRYFVHGQMRAPTKGETITRVNGNVSFFAGKRLQNF